MKMPRLMPLVAIAAGGVFAINAVENGPGIIGAARSFAEGVAAKHGDAKAATAVAADASATAPLDAAQVVAAKPAPICAESPAQLAKDAGLSPAELQVIQSLGARRGELDEREQGLDTQLALIQAAEVKVDARIATMNQLKADMQALVGQVDTKQQAITKDAPKAGGGQTGGKGADVASIDLQGLDFPYPGYLQNIVRQIALNFSPKGNVGALHAEVFFMIHRDGKVTDVRFISRSGNLAFDIEAQGAIDAAWRGFGALPTGYPDDVLPIVFSFDPSKLRN